MYSFAISEISENIGRVFSGHISVCLLPELIYRVFYWFLVRFGNIRLLAGLHGERVVKKDYAGQLSTTICQP